MQESEIWDLIGKHLSGNTSPSEEIRLKEWLDADKENLKTFEIQQALWNNTVKLKSDYNQEERWRALRAQIAIEEPEKRFPISTFFKIAASFALLLAIALIFKTTLFTQPKIISIKAPSDKAEQFVLPDKSKVWLNKGSELSFPAQFSKLSREVELKGEGFFEIVKNPDKPFIILSKGTKTQVLGTSFNLSALEDEDEVEVNVVTGKVAFYKEGTEHSKIILLPGENGIYNSKSDKITKEQETNYNFLAWKTGTLKFDNASLSEVFEALEKKYDYKFYVTNPTILNCRITSTFHNKNIEKVLLELEILLEIDFKIQNQKVVISGPGCK